CARDYGSSLAWFAYW
nr:immunoglobulin heavy chain junction region [Mus musculus]